MDGSAKLRESDGLARGLMADSVGPRLRRLRNLLSTRAIAALAPFGLRVGALTTMTLIDANEGCSQVELARELGVDKSAVVAIVDELEACGLAVRDRSTLDRRRNELSLTPKGEQTMRAMYKIADAQEAAIRSALTAAEWAQLQTSLDRAYDALFAGGG